MGENKINENKGFLFTGLSDNDSGFVPIMADGGEDELFVRNLPDELPILPLRNTVLFPGVVLPISVGRSKSLKLIREVYKRNGVLGTLAQLNPDTDDPGLADLYKVGTVAKILKILEMPDGNTTVIIQGKQRYELLDFVAEEPYHVARVKNLVDARPIGEATEFEAIVESLKDIAIKIAKYSINVPPEATFAVRNIENPVFLINFVCSNSNIKVDEKQGLLELDSLSERGIQAISFLVRELQMLELKRDIQSKVKTDMDQQQREYLLHQQMKTIQDE
ncbi:MAG TPA: LON peptidase substrate-binding domain-containing protein, partial [Prolixibacteraceae bacterium]|nr:LON peptidase substrate-binding domain-containing protein [Prolixibacteraceae bacterium]